MIYILLDKSMSGWRPKTSKRGGILHIWKPVPLAMMIENAVDCTMGIFLYQDIVDMSTKHWKKKYTNPVVELYLQKSEDISYHMAEVLHQAKNFNAVKAG